MFYNVSISPTLLGGTEPSDGFIDPSSVESYRARRIFTGQVAGPTIVPNSSFRVCGVEVTTSGNDAASLADDINEKSFQHGVRASVTLLDELVLRLLPGYEQNVLTLRDITPGTVASFGFDNPVISPIESLPPTLDLTLTKERANVRWNLILESLQLSSNVKVTVIQSDGGSPEDDVTDLRFIVETPDNYYNFDFTGQVVYGKLAIKYAIAKTLMYNVIRNREYNDPTQDPDNRVAGSGIYPVEVGQLTSVMQDAIDSVTVEVSAIN